MINPPMPNIVEQLPAGGNVSAPESGSYGEAVEIERLRRDLPDMTAPAAPQPASLPSVPPPATERPSSGLPPGLIAPSRQPDIDVSTPLTQRSSPILETSTQRNVAMLETLAASQTVSQETRQWAQLVLLQAKARLQA